MCHIGRYGAPVVNQGFAGPGLSLASLFQRAYAHHARAPASCIHYAVLFVRHACWHDKRVGAVHHAGEQGPCMESYMHHRQGHSLPQLKKPIELDISQTWVRGLREAEFIVCVCVFDYI